MTNLRKTTVLLEREEILGDQVYFLERDEETDEALTRVELPVGLDEDLGSPDTITVSIEPGDKLSKSKS